MEGDDAQEIKRLSDELTQTSSQDRGNDVLPAASQQQAHAGAGGGVPAGGSCIKKDDDVVDADFEEVKK